MRLLGPTFFIYAYFCSFAFAQNVETLYFQESPDAPYLLVDVLQDDLLQFEVGMNKSLFTAKTPKTEGVIWKGPMIEKRSFTGPKELTTFANGFATQRLAVKVSQDPFCVEVHEKDKKPSLLNKICPKNLTRPWKSLQWQSPHTQNAYGLGQYFRNPETANGDWVGEEWDPLPNSHGHMMRGFNGGASSYIQFPVIYALGENKHNYALLFNHVYKQHWQLKSRPWQVSTFGDQVRWFLIAGDDIKDLRRKYMTLSGLPPVPPKKVFGLWVSEFGYESWDELHSELEAMERADFPVDGFALDLQWFGGNFYDIGDSEQARAKRRRSRFGTLSFDTANFPRPANTIQQLRDQRGVHLMPIEESYVSKYLKRYHKDSIYNEMSVQGFFARDCGSTNDTYLDANPWWGEGGMVDWTNPRAGKYWHDQKRQALIDMGLTFHWTDLGEPEMYSSDSCYFGLPELGKRQHPDIHNVFNFFWLKSIADGYERNAVTERPFMMSRAGNIGLQRLGAGMWSGDVPANMGGLRAHLNAQMHMSFVGIDYYGGDVGGFHRRKHTIGGDPKQPVSIKYDALFTQWFANAALFDLPLRPHTWDLADDRPTNPTKIGDLKSNKFNIIQRYELAPYYYSLAHRAHHFGEPVIPPMVYEFQEDHNLREVGHQKMIGPFLMAGAVAEFKEIDRGIYFPRGSWINFHTNEWFVGQNKMVSHLPVHQDGKLRLPLFVRAGAIVPMQVVPAGTRNIFGHRLDGKPVNSTLRIRVYADSEKSNFTLYEDDGHSQEYKAGQVAKTLLSQSYKDNKLSLQMAATEGSFRGQKQQRPLLIEAILPAKMATEVTYNGYTLPPCSIVKSESTSCFENSNYNQVTVQLASTSIRSKKKVIVHTQPVPAKKTSSFFVCDNVKTGLGEALYVTGNTDSLGNWDPAKAVRLDVFAWTYPKWSGWVGNFPANTEVEWKCMKRDEVFSGEKGKVIEVSESQFFTTGPEGYNGLQYKRID